MTAQEMIESIIRPSLSEQTVATARQVLAGQRRGLRGSLAFVGPAVIAPMGDVTMVHCTWDAPNFEAVFWEVDPEERPFIVGVVAFVNCTFSRCVFSDVGVAGDAALRQALGGALG